MAELIAGLSPERRDAILKRAEELIREERGGRSAPESSRDNRGIAVSIAVGVVLAIGLLIWVIVT
ncbi:hypothetical protein [Bradyrhizobium phage BDU-MI-1]|nr:hypothetical protein [Bradyrhizobium phage BDU-MI-1]